MALCGRCGNPVLGSAFINDVPLCHGGSSPTCYELETWRRSDAEKDAQADEVWGPGNWVVCTWCPPDHLGQPVRHSKKAHRND